ncbi:MAG TPA: hypothetical protein VGJ33_04895 [Candidatus Angelobacter sp.]|jgi:hypothetical protein
MYKRKKMQSALKRLEWQKAIAILKELKPINYSEVFTLIQDVIFSGALIQKRPFRTKEAAEFEEALKDISVSSQNRIAQATLKQHLNDKPLIEEAYAALLDTLEKTAIRKHTAAEQVWALLERLPREIEIVQEKLRSRAEKLRKNNPHRTVAADVMIEDSSGNLVNADVVADVMMKSLFSTIHMLAYEANWFKNGTIVLPSRVEISEEIEFKAGIHNLLSQFWDLLSDADDHLRYWGGELTRSKVPIVDDVPEHDVLKFAFKRHLEIYERIARERFDQLSLGLALPVQFLEKAPSPILDPSKASVRLSPQAYVSFEEVNAADILRRIYQLPMLQDQHRFGGLSPRQWLRGYAILQKCYARNANDHPVFQIITMDRSELSALLERGGLSNHEAALFIQEVTLQRGKRDLYDAPLLVDDVGILHFIAAGFANCSLPMVTASQIGSQQQGLEVKGNTFEASVLDLLTKAGLAAKGFKYHIDGKTYDCDAALLWEHNIFVFECKTHLIPSGSCEHSYYFWKSIQEDIRQCHRIVDDLRNHPEILERHFGKNIGIETIYPVVLNALPFSVPGPIAGVYLFDYSALNRFFTLPDITFTSPIMRSDGKRLLLEHRIGSFWKGKSPVPEDLVSAMEDPLQVKVNMAGWSIQIANFAISEGLAIEMPILHQKEPTIESIMHAQGLSHEQITTFAKASSEIIDEIRKTGPTAGEE